MDYTFVRDGVAEQVALERWGWGVVYKGGGELHQFGANGDFHQFQEVRQEDVEMLVMYRTDDMQKRIDMPVKGDIQLFHFYRKGRLDMGTERERAFHVYVFGWKDRATGACAYNYILPDDRLITSNHDIADLAIYEI